MLEAAGRGMWNAKPEVISQLRELYADMDDELEGVTGPTARTTAKGRGSKEPAAAKGRGGKESAAAAGAAGVTKANKELCKQELETN